MIHNECASCVKSNYCLFTNMLVNYSGLDLIAYQLVESIPGGIIAINALDVPDVYAEDIKVCIVDSGYDISHPDLPSEANGGTVTGSSSNGNPWDKDGFGHGESKYNMCDR